MIMRRFMGVLTEIFFDDPIYDIYTDSQSIYNSVSKIAENAVYIYREYA